MPTPRSSQPLCVLAVLFASASSASAQSDLTAQDVLDSAKLTFHNQADQITSKNASQHEWFRGFKSVIKETDSSFKVIAKNVSIPKGKFFSLAGTEARPGDMVRVRWKHGGQDKSCVFIYCGEETFPGSKKTCSFFIYPYHTRLEYNTVPARKHRQYLLMDKAEAHWGVTLDLIYHFSADPKRATRSDPKNKSAEVQTQWLRKSAWINEVFTTTTMLNGTAHYTLHRAANASGTTTSDTTASNLRSVVDFQALIRTPPPALTATNKRIPYGTSVEVLAEETVGGKAYAKVKQHGGAKTVFGWTLKSNLGSAKEFDPAMAPDDSVDLEKLTGLEAAMAAVYNARGKYLSEKAKELGAHPGGLAAVLHVETGGRGFDNDGRIIIRFENHLFWGKWGAAHKEKFDQHFKFNQAKNHHAENHQWRRTTTGAWVDFHKGMPVEKNPGEWEVMEFAKKLNENAALNSASYGIGQIMGFNHNGFDTVEEMVKKYDEGIRPQLDSFVAYIKATPNRLKGLKDKNYPLFVEGYNPGSTGYAANMKAAAEAYAKVTAGKKWASAPPADKSDFPRTIAALLATRDLTK